LVPLLLGLRVWPRRWGVLILWLAGQTYGTIGFLYIRHVSWAGTLLLGFYISLYFVVFCASVRWLAYRKGLPLTLVAPLVWTALESLRGWLLTGLPWLYLAYTQYEALTVIQVADLAGTAGVTFWLVAVNGAFTDAVRLVVRLRPTPRPNVALGTAAAVLALSVGAQVYGWVRLRTLPVRRGPRVAVVQGNIPQDVKNQATVASMGAMFERHIELTRPALEHEPAPDLVIWPETMAPAGMFDEAYNRFCREQLRALSRIRHTAQYSEQYETWHRQLRKRERALSEWQALLQPLRQRVPLLVSAVSHVVARPGGETEIDSHNSAYLLLPGRDRPVGRYDKLHLVPFGEYVPMRPLLGWAVGPLIPHDLEPGDRPAVFEVEGWRFAPTICYEDGFPALVAKRVRDGRADCVVNVTNEGWFKDGSELDEHLAIAAFRAVEGRVGVIRAANTGISAFVAPTGRVVSKLTDEAGRDREIAGVLHGIAMGCPRQPLYLALGDWLGTLCLAVWFLALVGFGARDLLRRSQGLCRQGRP
jgi:apolipoprotein N-acyltransferase